MRIGHATPTALFGLARAGFVSAVSAQGLSRAGMHPQRADAETEAETNGSRFVGEASCPDVIREYQQQHTRQPADGYGPDMSGSSAAGSGSATTLHRMAQGNGADHTPFCAIYSGI